MQDILKWTMNAVRDVDKILPPCDVLSQFAEIEKSNDNVVCQLIGHSENGNPIPAYSWGQQQRNVLFYGFPDPGEAVGGTAMLSLLQALCAGDEFLSSMNVSWHFIPVLNPDDQPDGGHSLHAVMRDPAKRDVDWCVNDPRSETTALIELINTTKPIASFPLHDDWHSRESIPPYIVTSRTLPLSLCEQFRANLAEFGIAMADEPDHAQMGPGFIHMKSSPDYPNSTFAIMERFGPSVVCELSLLEGIAERHLVAAQLAIAMLTLRWVIEDK